MDRQPELNAPRGWGAREVMPFVGILTVLLACVAAPALRYGYHGSFLVWNAWATPLDGLWPYLTQLGDSLIGGSVMVAVILLVKGERLRHERVALVWAGVAALVVLGLAVQLLKRNVFGAWHRPYGLYEGAWAIRYSDVEGGRYFSFPSGHAKTAVCCALLCAYALGATGQGVAALVGAVIAYSRVAVGMHYPLDVVAGAGLAVGVTVPLVGWLAPWGARWLATRSEGTQRRWQRGLLIAAVVGAGVGIGLRFF